MNVLFMCLGMFDDLSAGSVHIDLLKEFVRNGHTVCLLCKRERRTGKNTELSEEYGIHVLRVRTGNIKNTNIIEKGLSTVMVESRFKEAAKQYFSNIQFDLILYTTPPITFANVVQYIKKRDGAKSYLMLKDIFPQNAVDIGMLSKKGVKGLLYRYFRRKEKKLYAVSDHIGCMSPANAAYLLKHNPEIPPEKVGICPNSMEVRDLSLTDEEKINMREKYGLPIDKKIFVYGGNLGRPQGIPFLIECLRSQLDHPDAYFLIVGSGTEYGKLEAFFNQSRPTNMKLMKSIPKDDYDRMIAACDVGMIFLDHRFTIPNFPSRLLSYLQAKLPVLACTDPNTDIGKIMVEGGFGWWCESDDVQAFLSTVERILQSEHADRKEQAYRYLTDNYTVEVAYACIIDQLRLRNTQHR